MTRSVTGVYDGLVILEESALAIQSGQELERFDLGTIKINGTQYAVLTGYEVQDDTCWWCGGQIQGKRKTHYCRSRSHGDFESCFRQYWSHFSWNSAVLWALRRAGRKYENCGCEEKTIPWGLDFRSNLEVHHIVPLKGEGRFFSAFNLPWNLIVLCRDCHLELHAVMRGVSRPIPPNEFELALARGQYVFEELVKVE